MKGIQRDFNINEDNFNRIFEKKKVDGTYSDKIIKYEEEKIVPYVKSKGKTNYVHLEDTQKLYLEDSVQTNTFTSLDRAFKLHNTNKKHETRKNIDINDFNYSNDLDDHDLNLDNLNI